jgi:ABC-type glycerol-3-phosphate transport system permease component
MDQHKKVLGIIYIITSVLQILVLTLLSLLWSTIFGFIMTEIEPNEARIVEFVFSILRFIPWIIVLVISIPTLITGFGLLNGQRWALMMALVLGCLKILSFPIGTAIGIYSIWVYLENEKLEKSQAKIG